MKNNVFSLNTSIPNITSIQYMEQFIHEQKSKFKNGEDYIEHNNSILTSLIDLVNTYRIPCAYMIIKSMDCQLIQFYYDDSTKSKVTELMTCIVNIFNFQELDDVDCPIKNYISYLKDFSVELTQLPPQRKQSSKEEQLYVRIENLDAEMSIIFSIEDLVKDEKSTYHNKYKNELNELISKVKELHRSHETQITTIEYFSDRLRKLKTSHMPKNTDIDIDSLDFNDNNVHANVIDINSSDDIQVFNSEPNNNLIPQQGNQIAMTSNNVVVNKRRVSDYVSNMDLHRRQFLYYNEVLPFDEDLEIEYKQYSYPFNQTTNEEVTRQICGFLNAKGGRIYIGITDKKQVRGIILTNKNKDSLRNELVNCTYEFYPKCRTQKLSVHFIPVKDYKFDKYIKNMYVVKLIIKQGDTSRLYSVSNKRGYISHLRLPGQCANLTAEEIADEIIKRKERPMQQRSESEFDDVEPVPPINKEEIVVYNNENEYQDDIYSITVKVSHICMNASVKDIEYFFRNCNAISMKFFKEGNKNKGYGFLNFDNIADAKSTIEKYNLTQFGTKQLKLKLVYYNNNQ